MRADRRTSGAELRALRLGDPYVRAAIRVAQGFGHDYVGTEHMLLALAEDPEGEAGRALGRLDVDAADIRSAILAIVGVCDDVRRRPIDSDALATLGIDLDQVRDRLEATFGPGVLERPRGAQSVSLAPRLRRALVTACSRSNWSPPAPAVLLMSLAGVRGGMAARVLRQRGVGVDDLREALD